MKKPTQRYFDRSDTMVFEQGTGDPVVLVHGSLSDHRIWEAQRKNIASAYRYIALDLRYHGELPWQDSGQDYGCSHHVSQVVQFLRELDAGPVHLVGQSYGANVLTHVAMHHPELVRSLVIQEPAIQSLIAKDEQEDILNERNAAFSGAVDAVMAGKLALGAGRLIEALMKSGPDIWDAAPDYLRQMVLDNARTLPLLFSAPQASPISCEELAQIAIPVLIINGENTMRFYSHIGEQMGKCLPKCERVIIPNASHGPETQNSEAYAAVLLRFLRDGIAKSSPAQSVGL